MRMAISNIWEQTPQSIDEIQISPWIKISCCECARGMRDEYRTDSIIMRRFDKMRFDDLGNINNLVILLCRDGDCLHFDEKHLTFAILLEIALVSKVKDQVDR
jgi:hypothetical protein